MKNAGILYALLTSLFLSTGFIFAKYFLEFTNVETLNALWFWIAFFASAVVLLIRDKSKALIKFKQHWKDGLIVGGANAFAAVFWFKSIELAGPTVSAFILRFSTIFIIFLGVLFLKEKLHVHDIVGAAIAIGGAIVISIAGAEGESYASAGTLVAFAACFAIAIHQVLAKVYVKNIDPLSLVGFRVFYTGLFVLAYAIITGKLQPFPIAQLPLLTGAVVINALVGFIFLYKALELLDVSKVAVIRTLDPFVVVVFAFLFFRSMPSMSELVGGSLVVAGVLVATYGHSITTILRTVKWLPWF